MERTNSPVQTATVIVKFVGSEKEYEYFITNQIFQSDFDQRSSTRYFKITNEKNYTYSTPVQFIRYNFKPTAMAQRTIVTAVEMVREGFSNSFIKKAVYDKEKMIEKSQKIREVIKNNKEANDKFIINDVCFNINCESWETIVYWLDGETTSVICRGQVDKDAGIALCYMKKVTGEKFISILTKYGEEQ